VNWQQLAGTVQGNAGAIKMSVKGQPCTAHSRTCNQAAHPLRTRSAFTCFSSLSPILHHKQTSFQWMTSGQIAASVPSASMRAGKGLRRLHTAIVSIFMLASFETCRGSHLSRSCRMASWSAGEGPACGESRNTATLLISSSSGSSGDGSGRGAAAAATGWLGWLAWSHRPYCCTSLHQPASQQQVCLELLKG